MKKWSIKNIIKELLITLLMIFVISICLNYIRKPNTDIQLPDIIKRDINNQEVVFETYGKPVVIHFWATGCPTCKLEASTIESLSKEYEVLSIAVNSGDDDEIKLFMDSHKLSYDTINDKNGKFAKKFSVSSFPTTFIYDKDAKIKFSEVGYSSTLGLKLRMWLAK